MQMTGGPDTGIDDTNCTGMEQRLIDCSLSLRVGDCKDEEHKVGLRCHKESQSLRTALDKAQYMKYLNISCTGVPRNPKLTVDEAVVRVAWEEPEGGTTDEQIQSYQVECSMFLSDNRTYTLK